jgi:hypothetical protein
MGKKKFVEIISTFQLFGKKYIKLLGQKVGSDLSVLSQRPSSSSLVCASEGNPRGRPTYTSSRRAHPPTQRSHAERVFAFSPKTCTHGTRRGHPTQSIKMCACASILSAEREGGRTGLSPFLSVLNSSAFSTILTILDLGGRGIACVKTTGGECVFCASLKLERRERGSLFLSPPLSLPIGFGFYESTREMR